MNREDKYADAFREEAAELLSDLEEVILLLEDDPNDQELINRLFRIMHTIKGSGAMFGFQKIADFAHHLETMLDLVRTGSISITPELTELLLQSRDQIQVMLYANNSEDCNLNYDTGSKPGLAGKQPAPGAVEQILIGLKRLQDQLSPAKPGEKTVISNQVSVISENTENFKLKTDNFSSGVPSSHGPSPLPLSLGGRGQGEGRSFHESLSREESFKEGMSPMVDGERVSSCEASPTPDLEPATSQPARNGDTKRNVQKGTGKEGMPSRISHLAFEMRDDIPFLCPHSLTNDHPHLSAPLTAEGYATESATSQSTYRLRIKLDPKVMASGLDPLCLLRDLQSMGECVISAQTDHVPWLEEMDPEECYFYWDVIINTSASLADLEVIFLFVQDESQISITRLNDESSEDGTPGSLTHAPLAAVEQKKIGEILVERGDVTVEQVREVLARQKRSGDLMVEAGIVSRGKVESALIEQKIVRQLRTPATPATGGQPAADAARVSGDTIRVSIKKLDRLINLVGEMVITQAQLSQTCARYQDTDILTPVESIERLTNELRDCALNIRMLPIETTFGKFRRLVHDLSASLGKQAELVTFGGETELDKTVIERIHDPLVHLIRNSLDHGIESPDERLREGKPAAGTIRLSAGQSGGEVIITIEDDGAGLDREKIWAKGVERGLIKTGVRSQESGVRIKEQETGVRSQESGVRIKEQDHLADVKGSEADTMTDSQIFNLIFLPCFSTAAKVSDVSGRGVGMDVVRREISKLRGSVDIKSQKGQGTKTSIHLPLTLAIIEGLLVAVGSSHYVIPLTFVQECVELTSQDVAHAHGRHVIYLRGEIIPYIRLRELFTTAGGAPVSGQTEPEKTVNRYPLTVKVSTVNGQRPTLQRSTLQHSNAMSGERPSIEYVVVAMVEGKRIGLVTDTIIGDYQAVIKSLGKVYEHTEGLSGATILGDGTIALIMDVRQLIECAYRQEKKTTGAPLAMG